MKGEPGKSEAGLNPRMAHISSQMSMKGESNSGFIIVTAIAFMAITAAFAALALYIAASNQRQSAALVSTTQAQYAAEAGIENTIKTYWFDLFTPISPNLRSLARYRIALSIPLPALLPVGLRNFKSVDNVLSLSGTVPLNTGVANYTVTLTRFDINDSYPRRTILRAKSTGTLSNGTTRVITQDLIAQAPPFNGLEFAMLTNNANCVFCHAKITSMEDAYAPRPSANSGRLDRIKMATLNKLEVRAGSADTMVGGSLYTRGTLEYDVNGGGSGMIPDGSIAGLNVKSYDIDANGKVGTNSNTPLTSTTDCTIVSNCGPFQNLYRNYPQGDGPDGKIPDTFPLPVPDVNGNRKIDDGTDGAGNPNGSPTEWQDAQLETVVDDGALGRLENGVIQQFTGLYNPTQPTLLSVGGGSSSVGGNLVLKGTLASPIKISGTVYVDGDVVISGRVSGDGKIIAKGNIYVVGDLEYDCQATQGQSTCNYSQPATLPRLGLIAGGNTMVGDYLTPRLTWPNTGSAGSYLRRPDGTAAGGQGNAAKSSSYTAATTDKNYIEPQLVKNGSGTLVLQVRGATGTVQTIPRNGVNTSLVAAEVAVFNKSELSKYNAAVPAGSYKPRFYRWGNSSTVFYQTGGSSEEPIIYDNVSEVPSAALAAATIVDMAPQSSWIDQTQLKQFWIDNVETGTRATYDTNIQGFKTGQNKAMQIDGLLYSSNAVFTLARSASKIQGSMILNGALVAADTGILSSGRDANNATTSSTMNNSFRVHYDKRLQTLFSPASGTQLGRSDYKLVAQ